jgi:hypothetical protein
MYSNLSTSFTLYLLGPKRKVKQYSSYKMLDGPHSQFECCGKEKNSYLTRDRTMIPL